MSEFQEENRENTGNTGNTENAVHADNVVHAEGAVHADNVVHAEDTVHADNVVHAENTKSESKENSLYSFRFRNVDSTSHDGDHEAGRDNVSQNTGASPEPAEPVQQTAGAALNQTVTQAAGAAQNQTVTQAAGSRQSTGQPQYSYRPQNGSASGTETPHQQTPNQQTLNQQTSHQQTSNQETPHQQTPNQERKSYELPKRKRRYSGGSGDGEPPKKKTRGAGARFGLNLLKCIAFAVVFGLIAGGLFRAFNPDTGNVSVTPALTDAADNGTKAADASGETAENEGGEKTADAGTGSYTVTDVSAVVEKAMPAIVSITTVTQTEYYDFFGQSESYESENGGSGVIIKDDDNYLYIATNHHVVQGANSLKVTFIDNESIEATVKGTEASADLGVIEVEKKKMKKSTLKAIHTAVMGNSDNMKVGEPCVVIGNALGYGQSVTAGVISAKERQVRTKDSSTGAIYENNLIQTDAAINPGNSGGALLDADGKLAGISCGKYLDTSVEGMCFAIPISSAEPILNNIIAGKKTETGGNAYLGIVGQDVSETASSVYGIPVGVYVSSVEEGTAAQSAGLQKGDVITAFDDTRITQMTALRSLIAGKKAGDEVKITYSRADNGEYVSKELTLKLGERPQTEG